MIGSVTEVQAQMADLEKRRKKPERDRRDIVSADTEAVGMGYLDAQQAAADDAEGTKSYHDRGAVQGPAQPVQPGHPEPADFGRPYVESGHAAESPQAQPPRQNPMPAMTHQVLPAEPMAARIPPQVIAHYTSGSPSERAR